MRIQPITTTNNNPQFKRLEICEPQKWDLDVLETVVKNTEIRAYSKHLDSLGKNLFLTFSECLGLFTIGKGNGFDTWKKLFEAESKQALLEKVSQFNFKEYLAKEEKEDTSKSRLDSLLQELDNFNDSLSK